MRPKLPIAWANGGDWLLWAGREEPIRLQKGCSDGFGVHAECALEDQAHELAGRDVGGAAEGHGVFSAEVSVHVGVGMLAAEGKVVEVRGRKREGERASARKENDTEE